MIDDGYRSLDHAIEILRGCVAPYSGEQAQKVAVVLKQWHDKWEAAVDVIYPDERDTIKTLKAEVERMRAEIASKNKLLPSLIAEGKLIEVERAAEAEAKLADALRRIAEMRAAAREFRFHEDITRFDCSDTPLETADDYNRLLAALKRIAEMGEAK